MDAARSDITAERAADGTPPARGTIAARLAALRPVGWAGTETLSDRWLSLLVTTRTIAAATATVLLIFHRITPDDGWFVVAVLAYAAGSIAAFTARPQLRALPPAWLLDTAAPLVMVGLAGEWRSPFYLLCLTTLILPATALPFRGAIAWGFSFSATYLGLALVTHLDWDELRSTARLETLVTHLMVPLLVVLALAYAAQLLTRLREERERAGRLALEAERRRIAWDLHDSAKQRIHAAHLVLSSLRGAGRESPDDRLDLALAELQSAIADMQTSLAELRTPLEGRRLDEALRHRARQLQSATDAAIEVRGGVPRLDPFVTAHAHRIASEALLNAVRHAGASQITVSVATRDGTLTVVVADDGCGMPAARRPGSTGLRSMRNRATTIGGRLLIGPGAGGRGTAVRLDVPLSPDVALSPEPPRADDLARAADLPPCADEAPPPDSTLDPAAQGDRP